MEEIMKILHFENDPKIINALEEVKIIKATASDHMLNIIQNINPLYRMLQPVQDQRKPRADDRSGCDADDESVPCVTYILTRKDGNINLIR